MSAQRPDDAGLSTDATHVAFEMAKARLDRQTTRLAEIRTNGSVLVAATGLIASFLGKASLDRSGLSAATGPRSSSWSRASSRASARCGRCKTSRPARASTTASC